MGREKFLPHTKTDYLRKALKKEKDPKARTKLVACIHKKEGKTNVEIADILKVPRSTVGYWLSNISRGGIRRRRAIKRKGAACKLNKEQRKQLVRNMMAGSGKFGLGAGTWTVPLVARHIKKEFGVDYDLHSVWELIRRLGFSYKAPRPANPKRAGPKEREEFKKKAARLAARYKKAGRDSFTVDEMHLGKQGRVHKDWLLRHGRPIAPVSPNRSRISIIGAIGPGGKSFFKTYETANSENMVDFLVALHKKFDRPIVFMDNASYHGEKVLEEVSRITGDEVVAVYFPKYTPELNPTETQWVAIRRYLANNLYDSIDDACDALMDGLKNKLIRIVKLHDYLLPS